MIEFQHLDRYDLNDLLRIMELLRSPEGCPWDSRQTHQSIRRDMLEEAYEVAEAIDNNDPAALKEELGDVLFQVVFHARMAEEEGLFNFSDVVDGVAQKMVSRHTHVFGSAQADNVGQALRNWDARKQEEKGQKTVGDTLDAVARSLPALMRAEKIQKKAQKAGFDWDNINPVLDKIQEETQELRTAVAEQSNIEEELGDLLFAVVKAGRFLGLDSELVLHAACEKFIRRFRQVEALADRPMTEMDISELEGLWKQAKHHENH